MSPSYFTVIIDEKRCTVASAVNVTDDSPICGSSEETIRGHVTISVIVRYMSWGA
jgi:hypothetical protein